MSAAPETTSALGSHSEPPDDQPGGTPRTKSGTLEGLSARFGVLGFLVVIIALFSALRPDTFPTSGNIVATLGSDETILFLALGVTLTLRLGDLDLSFGATMGTTAVIVAEFSVNLHTNIWVALAAGVAFGAAAGAFNALLVVKVGLNSFVATLGTMTVIEGIGYGVSKSTVINGISPGLGNFIVGKFLTIPIGVWLGWALLVIIWVVYQATPFGRLLLFIGGNREAARLLGLPVARIRFTAYVLSGVIFALGGIILVGSIGSADPSVSSQYLLPPLAAAFLGTTTIQLGRFNAFGTLVGAYVLAVISTGLQLLGASSWVGYIFNGAALLAAIGLARLARGAASSGGALGV